MTCRRLGDAVFVGGKCISFEILGPEELSPRVKIAASCVVRALAGGNRARGLVGVGVGVGACMDRGSPQGDPLSTQLGYQAQRAPVASQRRRSAVLSKVHPATTLGWMSRRVKRIARVRTPPGQVTVRLQQHRRHGSECQSLALEPSPPANGKGFSAARLFLRHGPRSTHRSPWRAIVLQTAE